MTEFSLSRRGFHTAGQVLMAEPPGPGPLLRRNRT